MVFNSFTFIGFLAAVLALHHLPLPWRAKKFNLLWASYLFYAAWNPPFVGLLWLSTVVDWIAAKRIHSAQSPLGRRAWLSLSLATNLGLLAAFKYGQFLIDNFTWALHHLGVEYAPPEFDIILPVGISFYTFQTLSYTLDVYLKRLRPWHSFLDYALYVTFFPQLVAGPIVRGSEFLPQCNEPRRATLDQFSWGLFLFAVGLFQKVVVADGLLAPVVEKVYDGWLLPDSLSAWCGTLAFSGQIFCDFAGYSSCAIGVGMCLGFRIPDNFRYPYAAHGFSDFWRRWHISLSSWLRDYLYIPLGGNRKGPLRTYVNLMTTMLLGGLWHGASWTFVFWGGLHGLYLTAERLLRAASPPSRLTRRLFPPIAVRALTFVLVCLAWVFFRANTIQSGLALVASMFGAATATTHRLLDDWDLLVVTITLALLLGFQWRMADTNLETTCRRLPWWSIASAIAVMLFLVCTMPGEDRAFIYFQF